MEFAWAIDAVVGLLVLVSAYLAMVRGLIKELFALASWVLAFLAAFFFAETVRPMLQELPTVGDYLQDDCRAIVVAFIVVFGLTLIVTGLFIWLIGRGGQGAASVVDQGLGFIYGALRGLVLVAVIYIGYDTALPEEQKFPVVEQAFSTQVISSVADTIRENAPDEVPEFLRTRMEALLAACAVASETPELGG